MAMTFIVKSINIAFAILFKNSIGIAIVITFATCMAIVIAIYFSSIANNPAVLPGYQSNHLTPPSEGSQPFVSVIGI